MFYDHSHSHSLWRRFSPNLGEFGPSVLIYVIVIIVIAFVVAAGFVIFCYNVFMVILKNRRFLGISRNF